MLGWILLGLATVAVGVVVISGIISKSHIREKMREYGMKEAIITTIDNCTNTVKIEELNSDETLEIRGDDLDYELKVYDTIIV